MDKRQRTDRRRSLLLIADVVVGVMVAIATGQALWSVVGYLAALWR